MSTVSKVPNDGSVTRVLSSSRGDVIGKAMAFMLAQYTSLQEDLDFQIATIGERNATKKLWNNQLSNINKLLQSPEFVGKKTEDGVTLYVKAEEMPYKDYAVVKDAEGNVSLQPAPKDESNMVSKDELVKIYGAPGSDPQAALEHYVDLRSARDNARKIGDTETYNALDAQMKSLEQNVCGYRVKISAQQLNKQLDVVRTSIDDLNADGQIDTLRMSDLFSKSNAKIEQLSKILSSVNETSQKIISSMA
jgi:hypothetical protein